jgi:DNA excision repair protein ERCC-4
MTARPASSGRRPATPLSRSSQQPVTVLVDTREQEPYTFDTRLVAAERRALPAGDYSVAGLDDLVAVERKSLDDFVSTVIHNRRRFREELKKLASYRAACVAVEGSLLDVLLGRYRGGAHPNAVVGSALSIILDYRVPVFFCSSRQGACQFVQAYLLGAHARWHA